MSGSIEKLTAAVEANTEIQEKVLAVLQDGAKPSAAKPASKPAAKPASKPTKAKKTTVDDIAKAFGDYLAIKDKEERDLRMANVKAIIAHFRVPKATEIDPDDFDAALGYLQQYIDGETPDFVDEEGGGEDDPALV